MERALGFGFWGRGFLLGRGWWRCGNGFGGRMRDLLVLMDLDSVSTSHTTRSALAYKWQ